MAHSFTRVHALRKIRSFVKEDQKDRDKYISLMLGAEVSGAFRSRAKLILDGLWSGQHIITSGITYPLLRELDFIGEHSINLVQKNSLEIVRSRSREIMQQQYEKNERQYNLRTTVEILVEGQEVFRRNFKKSNFAGGHNAKFGPRFLKAHISKRLGGAYYDLEHM